MSPAAVLIPPSLDSKQAIRLRRFGVASLSYVLATAMVIVGWLFGAVPTATLLNAVAAFVALNLGLYLAIRSGFNLRFKDPSLTRFQIIAAITVLMCIVYRMDEGRNIALFACFIVFLFGIARLTAREFVAITLYTLAAYALVINLLMHFRPQAIHDVSHEWMSWLGLAGFLPCFNIIGAQINGLRRRMRDSAEELLVFADNVPAMIVSWDANLHCRFANRAYVEFFDLVVGGVVGKSVREVLGETVYREVENHFNDVMRGYPVSYQRTHKRPDGESRHLEIRLLPNLDDRGKVLGCFSVISDITEYKLAEERIQRVAHHDGLTDLPNRLLFNDRLGQAINLARRDSRQVALLYLDLDRFKPINDALGHAAGDELLKEVAARIRRQVRESDTVARIGGDEFAVILPGIAEREKGETIARKIVAAIAEPFQLGSPKQRIEIGASIGIALYPVDAQDADALVKAADAAMYGVKQSGKQAIPRAA